MNRIFNSCDGVIGVQTVDGILDDGWRGVNEEQALFAALGKPKAATFADMLADTTDEILMQQCETLVEYLRYQGARD
jgi:hypothetical protein